MSAQQRRYDLVREKDFQQQIIELLALHGWQHVNLRDASSSARCRTHRTATRSQPHRCRVLDMARCKDCRLRHGHDQQTRGQGLRASRVVDRALRCSARRLRTRSSVSQPSVLQSTAPGSGYASSQRAARRSTERQAAPRWLVQERAQPR